MTATRVLGGILFVCALTIGELMNAVDAVSSHSVSDNSQVAGPQGSSAHRGLPYFGECWAPAPVFITNITANDHALMQASSEGLVALPPTQQQGEGGTHLFFFNGDASAGIAAAEDNNKNESSFKLLKTLPPSSGGSIIPGWLRAQGHTHSGDSDLLWLPTTNTTSAAKKGHVEPFIIVPSSGWPKVEPLPTFFAVNAKTLEDESRTLFSCQPTREEVNSNGQQQFAPWVAVQPPAAAAAPDSKTTVQQNFFYSSDYNIVEELFVYEVVETNQPNKTTTAANNVPRFGCKTHHTIKLSQGLIGAQGGSFLNHTHLLLASDDECIYTIDIRSGQVTVAACLWLQNLTETFSTAVAIATKSSPTTAATSTNGDGVHHHAQQQQQSHNNDVVTIFEMEGLAVADMTTLGWGMLHVLTGDTKLATHDGGTRPVFHLDYVC